MTDALSTLAIKILNANPDAYELLVVHGHTPALAHELLDGVQSNQLLTAPSTSPTAADAMLAGLWLWHDALEESHSLSQKLNTPEGSYWHAIMHRREGDFSNSKYWLAKCPNHPAGKLIAAKLPGIIGKSDPALARLSRGGWDPAGLVDLAERVDGQTSDPHHSLAIALQRLEWNCLFDHCAQLAQLARS
jgi:hypothetical protein